MTKEDLRKKWAILNLYHDGSFDAVVGIYNLALEDAFDELEQGMKPFYMRLGDAVIEVLASTLYSLKIDDDTDEDWDKAMKKAYKRHKKTMKDLK